MEHYDGPAFFRKFPVEPTPEQLEDTMDQRAERQVKQREQRNERLRIRKERELKRQAATQPVATPKQSVTKGQSEVRDQRPSRTTVSKPAEPVEAQKEPVAGSASYRPFQITPIPKQLHRQRSVSKTRQRYQHLVAQLQKPADSFFLIGQPGEMAVTTPGTLTVTDTQSAPATVADQPETVPEENQVATPVAPTVVFYPQHAAKEPVQADDASDDVSATADQAVTSDTVSQPSVPEGPTIGDVEEVLSEEDSAQDEHPLKAESTATKNETVDPRQAAYLPVGTSVDDKQTRVGESSETDSETEMSDSEAPEAPADDQSSDLVDAEPVVHDEDNAEVDVEGATNADHKSAEDASAQPEEVKELLNRAMDDQTDTSDSVASKDASEQVDLPADTRPESVKPAPKAAKAKPARGLGHSLGDIMQEEGNDQRSLALFDRPEVAATSEEEPLDTTRGYHFPDVDLLPKPVVPDEAALDEWIEHQAEVLDATLSAFHVDAHVTDWTVGPTVTQFQISLALGVKVNKITNLNDDLKLALAAKDIRIEAPIPGKTTVGIEIPNLKSRPVMLSEILNSTAFKNSESPLTVALGVDLFGKPQVTDLRKMPHGLIAGATGSGKSVFINSLLLSILYKATPAQVKLLLIDPKAVEMAPYDGLPHLLSPVISDPKAAAAALKWVVTEMDQRYEKLAAAGVRNIEQFNDRADANDEPALKMPYIVIIIDELADLMMMAASEVQDYIVRITQKARAAGIHLLVATQRPSVDIVTGTIKNNIPTRIAFMVSSQIDSRTILDTAGAENLLGRGDMLYLGNGASQPMRLQGAFVESEVDAITDYVRTQGQPHYAFEPKGLLQRETAEENQDELLPKVLTYIAAEKSVSTSKLQRVFSIGYNRAANLIDDLEQHHYVSPQHGSKPREVYLTPEDLDKDLPEPHAGGTH
ncbi:DNA translocase FtsK [Levilactobacillus yonginensis]|uniref:DNA translocase FtsK n=1 Tax=Levilactobacillus yonginensis TaxID=1054041 RepID=UPI00345CB4A4